MNVFFFFSKMSLFYIYYMHPLHTHKEEMLASSFVKLQSNQFKMQLQLMLHFETI